MEVVITERKMYGEKCPYCHELIKGASESAMKYNLGVHVDKHMRRGDLPIKMQ